MQKPKPKHTRVRDRNPKATSYVTNVQLLPVILRDQATGIMSEELGLMCLKIAEKYSRSNGYQSYSFREDLVAHAVVDMTVAWKKFDASRGNNPFSFLSTVCYYAFLRVLNVERQQRDIRDELLMDAGHSPSFGYTGSSDNAFGVGE